MKYDSTSFTTWTSPETVDTRAREYKFREGVHPWQASNRSRKKFRESAVRLVVEQNRSPSDVAKSLGVNVGTLKWWLREHRRTDVRIQAVEETGLRRRVRELEAQNQRLLMERDILKCRGVLREGAVVRFAFIRDQRGEFPVRVMTCTRPSTTTTEAFACGTNSSVEASTSVATPSPASCGNIRSGPRARSGSES